MDTKISNANDFKVVEFYNSTDFDFTPELGAMYDGRPLFVGSGEKRQFPYHVGYRLAVNLAKYVLIKGAPTANDNNPVGTPIWSDDKLEAMTRTFMTELYTESKPITVSETDRLMQRVAELEKLFKDGKGVESKPEPKLEVKSEIKTDKAYQDKAEVIAALEARGIAHDKRKKKEELEKLLA